jgi:hypothetical protein
VTGAMTTKNVVEHTPVHDALMKRQAQFVPAETKQNTTTGVDRWIRHVGSYISHDMVTSTLATSAQTANVSVTKNLLSRYTEACNHVLT